MMKANYVTLEKTEETATPYKQGNVWEAYVVKANPMSPKNTHKLSRKY